MGILTNTIANEAAGLLAWKPPIDVVATANVASLSGLQTIDGVTGAEGLSVLLTAQSTGAQNGPYLMSSGAWVRRSDMDLSSECVIGTSWRITQGTRAGKRYWLSGPVGSAITLGTTALTISEEPAAVGSDPSVTSLTASGFIGVGTAPLATSGEIRSDNVFVWRKRNAANDANIDVVSGSGNDLVFGGGVGNATIDVGTTGDLLIRLNFVTRATIDDDGAGNGRVTLAGDGQFVGAGHLVLNSAGGGTVFLQSAGANKIRISATGVGFYATSPVAQQADTVALTDNSGGTADNTIAAVSGSGADATINNNFADLAAKYNALRTLLRNYGLMA